MLEGVLAGPDGRWGLSSGTGAPSNGGTWSKADGVLRLVPRGREDVVLDQEGWPLVCDAGGEEAMVLVGVWI